MAKRRVFDSPWFYFVGAAVLVIAAVVSQVRLGPPESRPVASPEQVLEIRNRDDVNIVFIVIDMLRADRLPMYGYHRETSPNLSKLAETGVLFKSVESQSSWTKSSMASMWLGKYPQRTGIQRYQHGLSEDVKMPAEILSEAGYATGGVWRNGWVANNFGFGQGFNLYMRPLPAANAGIGVQHGNPNGSSLRGNDYDATETAMGFLDSYGNERFFLYIHYMDVHQFMYADSSPSYGSKLSDFYDAAIHWTDRNIGLIVDGLKDRDLLKETLIVIASDHGESFYEHGEEGHARSLFREVQQVPLLFILPFEIPGGLVIEQQVANVDIWPTILDLVGAPSLDDAEGKSLVPLMMSAAGMDAEGVDELVERPVFSQLDRAWGKVGKDDDPLTAMVTDRHRIIVDKNSPERSRLYDHSVDPLEAQNIATTEPEVFAELTADVNAFLETTSSNDVAPHEVEINEMRLHQLRALGYVIEQGPVLGDKDEEEAAQEEGGAEGAEAPE